MAKKLPPEVRTMPMSVKEFNTLEKVRHYFLEDLPCREEEDVSDRECAYWYQFYGLQTYPGSIVLFQFDNHLVASAEYIRLDEFRDDPWHDDEHGFTYYGRLILAKSSIMVFDPISQATVQAYWPKVKKFSQARHDLDTGAYSQFQAKEFHNIKRPPPCA
jgi:hypothetical protein